MHSIYLNEKISVIEISNMNIFLNITFKKEQIQDNMYFDETLGVAKTILASDRLIDKNKY